MNAFFRVFLGGLVATILTFIWFGFWLKVSKDGELKNASGFDKTFNLHPFLMVLSVIFLNLSAIVSFKTLPFSHECKKSFHMLLHTAALLLAFIGINAVFKSHNNAKPVPLQNFYSLHSWVGIAAICLYSLQYIFGFYRFYLQRGNGEQKEATKAWHKVLGKLLAVVFAVAAISGIQEKLTFNGTCTFVPDDDHDNASRQLHAGHESGKSTFDCNFGNLIGLTILGLVLFSISLFFPGPSNGQVNETSLELEELEELTAMDIS
mmetsp:Transcript_2839/g.3829  ORF Transcript_2839/g.3829 Transcript_2839/m.3829 type:complete len:263 (+) Transcript_2839:216-1004(+)